MFRYGVLSSAEPWSEETGQCSEPRQPQRPTYGESAVLRARSRQREAAELRVLLVLLRRHGWCGVEGAGGAGGAAAGAEERADKLQASDTRGSSWSGGEEKTHPRVERTTS